MDGYLASCSLASWLLRLLVSGVVLCRPGSAAGRCCCVSANWHLFIWTRASILKAPQLYWVKPPPHDPPRHTPLGDVACHLHNPTCPSKSTSTHLSSLPRNQPSFISRTLSLASIAAMVQGDYDLLLEMGFDAERATLAVKRTKGRRSRGLCSRPFFGPTDQQCSPGCSYLA